MEGDSTGMIGGTGSGAFFENSLRDLLLKVLDLVNLGRWSAVAAQGVGAALGLDDDETEPAAVEPTSSRLLGEGELVPGMG